MIVCHCPEDDCTCHASGLSPYQALDGSPMISDFRDHAKDTRKSSEGFWQAPLDWGLYTETED